MIKNTPILVRAMSRSGGTMLVTALDAHPDISMSYEFYPSLFEKENSDKKMLESRINKMELLKTISKAGKKETDKGWKKFINRSPRSGLDLQ